MSKLIEVTPLPKMGESLRALGYSAKTAIADIVDNCIDADGRDIRVEILGTENNLSIRRQRQMCIRDRSSP